MSWLGDGEGEEQDIEAVAEAPAEEAVDGDDDASVHVDDEHSLHDGDDNGHHAEVAVAESLTNALRQLREDADQLESMPLDEGRVEAAEALAEQAAQLDEQIGSVARADEG